MSPALERALARTGFTGGPDGDAAGLRRGYDAHSIHLEAAFAERGGLAADAVYETDDGPKLVIKAVDDGAASASVHERAWNLGLAPLLWVVTPVEVRVYDAFRGVGTEEDRSPIGIFELDVEAKMAELDDFCGRFSIDTGAFWSSSLAGDISRDGKVDAVLLQEIRALEARLVAASAPGRDPAAIAAARGRCQELITCTLFASYLFDRGLAGPMLPRGLGEGLAPILRSRERTQCLFRWLHETFNGDVFPAGIGAGLLDDHLRLLESFVTGTHLFGRDEGQIRLFPFRFDTVPIELISSVYESFAQRAASDMSKDLGVHYTRVELVHMALDPVFEGLPADATILDPTCGSGLFLVQSLRRLVWRRCGEGPRPRAVVRDILYRQVHGIDVQEAALRIAAFSLYLAALELETEAGAGEPIGFRHLIGLTLHRLDFLSADALGLARALRPGAIVGNPPWTHGVVDVPKPARGGPPAEVVARRSPDQRFLSRAIEVMGASGRIAMYLKAAPLLARSKEATAFRDALVRRLDRLAMLNMSPLRHEGLFADAQSPGLFLCANCGNLPDEGWMLVGTFPWTPDYAKGGALALSSADVRAVEKERVLASPSYLKASMAGTPRDAELMERIEADGAPLSELLEAAGVESGRGFQVKGGRPSRVPPEMARLPALWKTSEYSPGRLDGSRPSMSERNLTALWRTRTMRIYRGPLLILPKSAHGHAFQAGRTSASLHEGDLCYSENFYGFSFAEADRGLATILCALLNSSVPGFQLLFGAGALGTERPSVALQDIRALRFPRFAATDGLVEQAGRALAAAPSDRCKALDLFAGRLWGLAPHERALAADAVLRGASTFLDTEAARNADILAPDIDAMVRYAAAACGTVNAVLRLSGRRHLRAAIVPPRGPSPDPLDRFAAVRFFTCDGRAPADTVETVAPASADGLLDALRGQLVRAPTPYLRERRSLRVYDGPSVTFLKPAQRRYWTVADGMRDGDVMLADHAPPDRGGDA